MMMQVHAPAPTCQCGFVCSSCAQVANLVQMYVSDRSIKLIRSGFLGQAEYNRPIKELGRVTGAIMSGSAQAVHAFDLELLPGYCPTCDAIYCADHWHCRVIFDEGFYDCIRGRCPHGHERMLED